jgi:hypothetical protein
MLKGNQDRSRRTTHSSAIGEWKKKNREHEQTRRRGEAAADSDEDDRHANLIVISVPETA